MLNILQTAKAKDTEAHSGCPEQPGQYNTRGVCCLMTGLLDSSGFIWKVLHEDKNKFCPLDVEGDNRGGLQKQLNLCR